MSCDQAKLSYLHARDPSIISYGRRLGENVRKDLQTELMEVTAKPEEDNHIQVYLRIKKEDLVFYKIQDNILSCTIPEGSHVLRNMKNKDTIQKTYTFSRIFGPKSTQEDIFNNIVKEKMLSFINGNNISLLTYGVSGAGKTFTAVGTAQEPGLIPRSLEYLFRTLPKLSRISIGKPQANGTVIKLNDLQFKQEIQLMNNLINNSSILSDKNIHTKTYNEMQQHLMSETVAEIESIQDNVSISIWVSFAEIYNECIYDLLQIIDINNKLPISNIKKPSLHLGKNKNHVFIKNLTSILVRSGLEAYKILQYGLQHLNYAATKINQHSSRSHSIFTIKLVQYSENDGGSCISYFNFCDLAGSERMKKSLNVGDRLQESKNINKSLLTLGKCIELVRNLQKHSSGHQLIVPFRESKLTQLFQNALSGNESITMIVNINPSGDVFDETHHVLNFSAIAKDITIVQKPSQKKLPKRSGRLSYYIEQSQKENSNKNGDINEETDFLQNRILELEKEVELVKLESEQNEQLTRDHVINCYKNLMENREIFWKKKIDDLEHRLSSEYERKLDDLREYYQNLSNSKNEESIIILDSSAYSSDDNKDAETKKIEIEELKIENKNLTEKSEKLQLNFDLIKIEKDKLEEKCNSLNETLKDFVKYSNEMEEILKSKELEINNLTVNNIKLQDKVEELEMNCDIISSELERKDREIAQLEKKLKNIELELYRYKLETNEIIDNDNIVSGPSSTDSEFSSVDHNFEF